MVPRSSPSHTVFALFVLAANLLFLSDLQALDPKKRITQYDLRVYKAEHGLPMNDVKDVFQDSKGYLWLACQEGLLRFDGARFVLFDQTRHREFGENFVWDIAEDWEGNLWLATNGGGVKRFDGKTFTIFGTADGLASNVVKHLLISRDRTIWFGTENGLTRLRDGIYASYQFGDPSGSQEILALQEDGSGNVLVGSHQPGLHIVRADSTFTLPLAHSVFCFSERTSGEFIVGTGGNKLYLYHPLRVEEFGPREVPSFHLVRAIHDDHQGNLWFAAEGSGILRYHDGRFEHLNIETGLPQEHNYFMKILEDREENLWFVGDGGLLQLKDNKFITFGRNEGFASNFGHTVCEDRAGNMWAGFRSDGLARFDRQTTQSWRATDGLASDIVTAVFPAHNGGLWIGTSNGLNYLHQGRIRAHWKGWSASDGIFSLFENEAGALWMGMQCGVLSKFDGKKFVNFSLAAKRESGNVIAVIETVDGEVWAGTWKQGLYRLSGESVYHFTEKDGIRADGVNAFHEDQDRVLWIASDGQGLYRYKDGRFVNFNSRHGLCFDRLFSILEDDQHRLSFSGNRGVFSAEKKQFEDFAEGKINTISCRHYDHFDGMRETECNGRRQPVAWKSRDGRLWFVSTAGVVSVDPNHMPENTLPPPVFIEEVLTKNQGTLQPDSSVISLPAADRALEFRFTALSFVVPERVRFKYRLEGYDREWVEAGARRSAFYTNLPKGNYTFRAIACNNDGVWNQTGASIQFTIAPFWWETGWAYALYALLAAALLFGLRQYERKRARLRSDWQLERIRRERLQELDRLKSRFFAGISHEFRTPLTLIGGPLQEILERTRDTAQKERVNMMLRNTCRLQRLVDELLDLAQLESGKMTLQARPVPLVSFLQGLTLSFESYADQKQIELIFRADDELAAERLFLDPGKMEKIILNLLGNALKYTGPGGKVELTVTRFEEEGAKPKIPNTNSEARRENAEPAAQNRNQNTSAWPAGVEICVRDTGTGIPAKALPHVFDYFYRYRDKNTARESGTGIGLALTKELVELHHGEIFVTSKEGAGSAFTLRLPLGKAHLKAEEMASDNWEELDGLYDQHQQIAPLEAFEQEAPEDVAPRQDPSSLPTVLLVEDNADMRRYLRKYLNRDNRLLEAANGEEGLQKALQEIPDLIVSDVMMPCLDGFELCRTLKTTELTSHIPVLLLTARGSGESRIEGLELGADDYLTKPIAGRELQLRIKNLIERQLKLREHFRKELLTLEGRRDSFALASADEKFLHKAREILEKHLANPNFGPDAFARAMALSRPHLNRKLLGLLGQHTNEFIRAMRLKSAAELLRQKSGTVSEIAFRAGFNHLSYFARCFKEQYGQSPSEYLQS